MPLLLKDACILCIIILHNRRIIYTIAGMNSTEIENYLTKLAEAYDALGGRDLTITICGGAGLMLLGLVDRTTKDIDLIEPAQLPKEFDEAARIVAREYNLPANWINQGPKQLAEMGLPPRFHERATTKRYGKRLSVCIASRRDQIFFKIYAAADRGGYHAEDLMKLEPTNEELKAGAGWCMTHDVSPAFESVLKDMMEKLGYEEVARSL